MPVDVKAKFQKAGQLLAAGHASEAEKEYREIKRLDPKHFLATYNLAVIVFQSGRIPEAERLMSEAVALQPSFLQALMLRAKMRTDLDRIDEAVADYDRVLAAQPNNPDALSDRAVALFKRNRFKEAIADLDAALTAAPTHLPALYNRAIALEGLQAFAQALAPINKVVALKPDFVEGLFFRGNLQRRLGNSEAAAADYRAAFARAPKRADILNNLGSLLFDKGQWNEALETFERAINLRPENCEALVNRGRALGKMGRAQEELAAYDRALKIQPGFAEAYLSRGVCLMNLRRFAEALADLDKTMSLAPTHEKALQARGNILMSLGRRDEAVASYDQILRAQPTQADALNSRALALRMMGRFEESAETYARLLAAHPNSPSVRGDLFAARLQCCDWTDYDKISASIVEGVRNGTRAEHPFLFLAHAQSPADQLLCAQHYADDKFPRAARARWTAQANNNEKIKLAYISADFRNHATAHLMAGMFEAHDRDRFETLAISLGSNEDSDINRRLRSSFARFVDASTMTDDAVIDLLRVNKIDIAVDLKGFTNEARPGIFATRGAPLQVSYVGYPCTWGSPCMDYLIADPHIIPAGYEIHYAEKIVRLPDTYQPNDDKRVIADKVFTRAEVGLPERGFVFCSFNGSYKITPAVFDVWMRLLKAVDGSVLWLIEGAASAPKNLRHEAEKRGVAGERLIFAPLAAPEHHLARHRLADLFLDTSPINAHTTASDSLWAGLPLVTYAGETFAGRVAASLLHAVGLPELVTRSWADYEALALKLATAPQMLAAIRAKLMRNRDTRPLFDTTRLCRHLETAFATMHARQQQNLPPQSFTIPAQE